MFKKSVQEMNVVSAYPLCNYENCTLPIYHPGNHDLGETEIECPITGKTFHFMANGTGKWWLECPVSHETSDTELHYEKQNLTNDEPYPDWLLEVHQ